jgi:NAD(P)-dependent dehydrogenase (short-subunit alcohol dehydrogenase family)
MSTVMIIGASRGIGLEFARQYAAAGWRVHATTRTPAQRGALGNIEGEVVIHALDVRYVPQIKTLAQAMLAAVTRSREKKIVLLTSQLGARRGSTGSLGLYGDSKSVLNDAFRAHAPTWGRAGLLAIVMHPGWVRTDMGGAGAPLAVQESVHGMRQVVARVTSAEHGRFWTWEGREHPW